MSHTQSLAQRFEAIRQQVGGNREKQHFEFTFGPAPEEMAHISPPNRTIVRILSELHFALELSRIRENVFDPVISRAMDSLENCLSRHGVLTFDACREAENALLPLQEEAKTFDLIYIAHAHIDMNWMWGFQETVAATLSTFRSVLHMMEEYPGFTFMQSQASVYKIVEDYDPALMPEIQKRIREGRWEVTANAWVETDKNMPGTESLLRHVSVTRDYLSSHWGIDMDRVNVDFSPDTFGHSRYLPELNTFAGVKYYYHCRGTKEDHVLFRYRGPSGAEILAYKEPYWYNNGIIPDGGIGLPQLSQLCGGLKTGLIVYGVGNHGGGPTRRDIERILEMQAWPVFPNIRFGTLHEFFEAAERVRDSLPVVDHELNFIFPGCYTTQSRIKMANRKCETSLNDTEQLCALGHLLAGAEYPGKRLAEAWQRVLFTHFHDILTGSCVQESREHAMGLYAEALSTTQTALGNAMRVLSESVDTSVFLSDEDTSDTQAEGAGAGAGVWFGIGHSMGRDLCHYAGVPNPERGAGKTRVYTVFNTGSVPRNDVVEITLWDYTGDLNRLEAIDRNGQNLPMQLDENMPQRYWDHMYARVFVRVSVPGLGYTVICLREKPLERFPVYRLDDIRVDNEMGPFLLENEYLAAKFDRSGMLVSLVDRQTGQEQLLAPAGFCCVDTEKSTSDAWHIARWLNTRPVNQTVRIKYHAGSVRPWLEIEQKVLTSTVKTRVSLDEGARELSYACEIDWNETGRGETVPLLVYLVPLRNQARTVLCDVPGGLLERPEGHIDVPCLSFAAVNNGQNRLTLAADSKYGYRLADGMLSCSLINSAANPDPYPERGLHRIHLWLRISQESRTDLKRRIDCLNRPMVPFSTKAQPGVLSAEMSLIGFDARSTILSGIFLDEEDRVHVRVYNVEGETDPVKLTLPCPVSQAWLTDLKGSRTDLLSFDHNIVTFDVKPYTITEAVIRMNAAPQNEHADSV